MRLIRCLTAALIAFSTAASATPFTYYFTIPGYVLNNDPSVFGTGMNLAITVDNSGSSGLSQTYQFSDITGVNATAIGGTFSFDFITSPSTTPIQNNDPVITTYSDGTPTLMLGNQNNALGYWINGNNPYGLTLAQIPATPSPTNVPFEVSYENYSAEYNLLYFDTEAPVDIIGTTTPPQGSPPPQNPPPPGPTPVPDPASWLMMLTGLGLLAPLYRRHRKGQRKLV